MKNRTQAEDNSAQPSFVYKKANRYRRNVLDLITIFGSGAIKSHLLCDVDMSKIEATRRRYEEKTGHKLTVTAFILKAISIAQQSHPVSRTFALPFSRTVTYNDTVAGFTVEREVDGEPIVFFGEVQEPHLKAVSAIADELKEYSSNELITVPKLRDQVLFARMPGVLRRLILLAGFYFPFFRLMCMQSTFGLSSLGALGVNACYGPCVCSCVFGVGAVEDRVEVRNGELEIREMMTLSLSFDQRVMNGAQAARFVRDIKLLLESGMEDTCDID